VFLVRARAPQAYYFSSHQRFFKELCVQSKVPAAIAQAEKALKEGKSVVIGLQSTGEAPTADAFAPSGGGEFDEFVSAPLETLKRFFKKFLPLPGDDEYEAPAAPAAKQGGGPTSRNSKRALF
jgi:hypothetical protein